MTTKQLDTARGRIAALKAQIADLERQPVSRDEVRAALLQRLEAQAAEAARPLRHMLSSLAEGDAYARPLSVLVPQPGSRLELGELLATVFGPAEIVEALEPHLAALPEGVPAAERRTRTRELRAELIEAEHQEQDIVDRLLAQGVEVAHRADADPRVVLRV